MKNQFAQVPVGKRNNYVMRTGTGELTYTEDATQAVELTPQEIVHLRTIQGNRLVVLEEQPRPQITADVLDLFIDLLKLCRQLGATELPELRNPEVTIGATLSGVIKRAQERGIHFNLDEVNSLRNTKVKRNVFVEYYINAIDCDSLDEFPIELLINQNIKPDTERFNLLVQTEMYKHPLINSGNSYDFDLIGASGRVIEHRVTNTEISPRTMDVPPPSFG